MPNPEDIEPEDDLPPEAGQEPVAEPFFPEVEGFDWRAAIMASTQGEARLKWLKDCPQIRRHAGTYTVQHTSNSKDSDFVDRANYEYLDGKYDFLESADGGVGFDEDEHEDEHEEDTSGQEGLVKYLAAIDPDEWESFVEDVESLDSYCCLDESRMSELEMEALDEWMETDGKKDLQNELEKADDFQDSFLQFAISKLSMSRVYDLARDHDWSYEGNAVYISMEDVAEDVEPDDILVDANGRDISGRLRRHFNRIKQWAWKHRLKETFVKECEAHLFEADPGAYTLFQNLSDERRFQFFLHLTPDSNFGTEEPGWYQDHTVKWTEQNKSMTREFWTVKIGDGGKEEEAMRVLAYEIVPEKIRAWASGQGYSDPRQMLLSLESALDVAKRCVLEGEDEDEFAAMGMTARDWVQMGGVGSYIPVYEDDAITIQIANSAETLASAIGSRPHACESDQNFDYYRRYHVPFIVKPKPALLDKDDTVADLYWIEEDEGDHTIRVKGEGISGGLWNIELKDLVAKIPSVATGLIQWFKKHLKDDPSHYLRMIFNVGGPAAMKPFQRYIKHGELPGYEFVAGLEYGKAGNLRMARRYLQSQDTKVEKKGCWIFFGDWTDTASMFGEDRNHDFKKSAEDLFGGDAFDWFDASEMSVDLGDVVRYLTPEHYKMIREALPGREYMDPNGDGEESITLSTQIVNGWDDDEVIAVIESYEENSDMEEIADALKSACREAQRQANEDATYLGYIKALESAIGCTEHKFLTKTIKKDGKDVVVDSLAFFLPWSAIEDAYTNWKDNSNDEYYEGDVKDLVENWATKAEPRDDYYGDIDDTIEEALNYALGELEAPGEPQNPDQPQLPLGESEDDDLTASQIVRRHSVGLPQFLLKNGFKRSPSGALRKLVGNYEVIVYFHMVEGIGKAAVYDSNEKLISEMTDGELELKKFISDFCQNQLSPLRESEDDDDLTAKQLIMQHGFHKSFEGFLKRNDFQQIGRYGWRKVVGLFEVEATNLHTAVPGFPDYWKLEVIKRTNRQCVTTFGGTTIYATDWLTKWLKENQKTPVVESGDDLTAKQLVMRHGHYQSLPEFLNRNGFYQNHFNRRTWEKTFGDTIVEVYWMPNNAWQLRTYSPENTDDPTGEIVASEDEIKDWLLNWTQTLHTVHGSEPLKESEEDDELSAKDLVMRHGFEQSFSQWLERNGFKKYRHPSTWKRTIGPRQYFVHDRHEFGWLVNIYGNGAGRGVTAKITGDEDDAKQALKYELGKYVEIAESEDDDISAKQLVMRHGWDQGMPKFLTDLGFREADSSTWIKKTDRDCIYVDQAVSGWRVEVHERGSTSWFQHVGSEEEMRGYITDLLSTSESSKRIVNNLLEEAYDYSCLMVNVPDEQAKAVQNWGKTAIPDENLFVEEDGGKGREGECHITVKWGLQIKKPNAELARVVEHTKAFPVKLGKVSLFRNEKFDVVKLDVESPWLNALHARVKAAVPNTETHPSYHPHCTVAYVKKGTCDKLEGMEVFSEEGQSVFYVYELLFKGAGEDGSKERVVVTLPLTKGENTVLPESIGNVDDDEDARGLVNRLANDDPDQEEQYVAWIDKGGKRHFVNKSGVFTWHEPASIPASRIAQLVDVAKSNNFDLQILPMSQVSQLESVVVFNENNEPVEPDDDFDPASFVRSTKFDLRVALEQAGFTPYGEGRSYTLRVGPYEFALDMPVTNSDGDSEGYWRVMRMTLLPGGHQRWKLLSEFEFGQDRVEMAWDLLGHEVAKAKSQQRLESEEAEEDDGFDPSGYVHQTAFDLPQFKLALEHNGFKPDEAGYLVWRQGNDRVVVRLPDETKAESGSWRFQTYRPGSRDWVTNSGMEFYNWRVHGRLLLIWERIRAAMEAAKRLGESAEAEEDDDFDPRHEIKRMSDDSIDDAYYVYNDENLCCGIGVGQTKATLSAFAQHQESQVLILGGMRYGYNSNMERAVDKIVEFFVSINGNHPFIVNPLTWADTEPYEPPPDANAEGYERIGYGLRRAGREIHEYQPGNLLFEVKKRLEPKGWTFKEENYQRVWATPPVQSVKENEDDDLTPMDIVRSQPMILQAWLKEKGFEHVDPDNYREVWQFKRPANPETGKFDYFMVYISRDTPGGYELSDYGGRWFNLYGPGEQEELRLKRDIDFWVFRRMSDGRPVNESDEDERSGPWHDHHSGDPARFARQWIKEQPLTMVAWMAKAGFEWKKEGAGDVEHWIKWLPPEGDKLASVRMWTPIRVYRREEDRYEVWRGGKLLVNGADMVEAQVAIMRAGGTIGESEEGGDDDVSARDIIMGMPKRLDVFLTERGFVPQPPSDWWHKVTRDCRIHVRVVRGKVGKNEIKVYANRRENREIFDRAYAPNDIEGDKLLRQQIDHFDGPVASTNRDEGVAESKEVDPFEKLPFPADEARFLKAKRKTRRKRPVL